MRFLNTPPPPPFVVSLSRCVSAVGRPVPVVAITVCSDPKNMNKLLRGVSAAVVVVFRKHTSRPTVLAMKAWGLSAV